MINSLPKKDVTGLIVLKVDKFYHLRIADVRLTRKLVDIFGMEKTEQEILSKPNVSVDASLSNINGLLGSDEVQILFVKSDYSQLGSCANKIRQIEDPTFEPDGLKEATYLGKQLKLLD